MTEKEILYLKRNKERALKRLKSSASKYVLLRKFNTAGRHGLKALIEDGIVEMFDAPFGRAYRLLGE